MALDRLISLFFVAYSLAPHVNAENSLWNTPEAYLGQTPPSDVPKVFAPGLLAETGSFVMGRVAFSPDGKDFYYAQADSWSSGSHTNIKAIQYANHHWNPPVTINEHFLSPTLSPDGRTLYMRKVVKGGSMNNVWKSQKKGNGWTVPIPFLDETFGVYDYMPTNSGNAYVGSEPSPDDAKNGITYAFSILTKSGNTVTVKSLGRPLNEPGFNGDLYISPDESYMIVSAKETKTYESQLYISFRKPNLTWTNPISLGERINGGLAHRWGQYVTPDGKYLFYTHGTSEKDCAVYWVRFDGLLQSLRTQ
jgi:WD40-like Beta Propeller Repeat